MLERKDVDAVDLCVPTHLHEEMILLAAEAGKHVICEKPLTGYFGGETDEEVGVKGLQGGHAQGCTGGLQADQKGR